ncbi:MAG: molybdopterin dinucleotide binding domain-containing protein, partial [Nannocystaceae bacterium]
SLRIDTTGQLQKNRLLTPHGQVGLAPAAIANRAAQELEEAFQKFRAPTKTTLHLISRRDRHGHNSWMHNITAMHPRGKHTNYLLIHPHDAGVRNLDATAIARVTSPTGHVDLPIKLSEDLMAGTVALPHGWGHGGADGLRVAQQTAGVNVNRLAPTGPSALEHHAGMARLNGIEVDVTRVPDHADLQPPESA